MRDYHPQVGETWRHFKGTKYQIIHLGKDVTRSDRVLPMVIYVAVDDIEIYCRTLKGFISTVEIDGQTRYRFERL
jgi:hypothetical protein